VDRRTNVEEVFKAHSGKYFGMHTGIEYDPSEVDEVHPGCYFTKPNHAADLWEPDSRDDYTKKD